MQERAGIAIAGNMLVDSIKRVATYPRPGLLAQIQDVSRGVGGCVPNTILDLAQMGGGYPLYALGRLGADEPGDYVAARLQEMGVDISGVIRSEKSATSFSDVMSALDTGERTFFHHKGANAEFCPEDVNLDRLSARMLHVGYLMLLDRFDAPDSVYGTAMARFLHDAQERGIATSIDAVSDAQGRYREIVLPALKYCDYAIMNEIEACAPFGLQPRDEADRLDQAQIRRALEGLMNAGVKRRAVIHCPEAGFCLDVETGFVAVPSFRLPKGYIQGSVGAGDAFCAGCLHGIYRGFAPADMLSYAAAAAAANLAAADSVSGMQDEETLLKITREWGRNEL